VDLLKSETQDDFIVGLQDTLADVLSTPAIVSIADVDDILIEMKNAK
jgi:hypothetical protein